MCPARPAKFLSFLSWDGFVQSRLRRCSVRRGTGCVVFIRGVSSVGIRHTDCQAKDALMSKVEAVKEDMEDLAAEARQASEKRKAAKESQETEQAQA